MERGGICGVSPSFLRLSIKDVSVLGVREGHSLRGDFTVLHVGTVGSLRSIAPSDCDHLTWHCGLANRTIGMSATTDGRIKGLPETMMAETDGSLAKPDTMSRRDAGERVRPLRGLAGGHGAELPATGQRCIGCGVPVKREFSSANLHVSSIDY
jgi:hypothetical protein